MIMSKKGQAAMEFLMTYGWAILAAIVVIAVLAWFGVFNLGNLAPSACVISAPFSCEEYGITETSGIQLVVRNGYGNTVDIASIDVMGCGSEDNSAAGWIVQDGQLVSGTTLTITCGTALTAGELFRGDINITYMKSGGSISQTASGSIKGEVAP
ncbi:MAG: hypothetical protein ABIH72_01610 [archaeon]